MSKTVYLTATLTLAAAAGLTAQRRVRIGPTVSSISLEDLSGNSHSFTGVAGSVALITGDDGETGLTIARYHDLSTDGGVRRLTLFALDSYYYPVGTRGIAPFAATTLGLARVTESATICPLLCGDTLSTSSQFALAFGLGVRVNLGRDAVATVEGRFLQVPGSQIQALELAASAAVALGPPRRGEFLAGTLGPEASFLIPLAGALRGRAPLVGVRFRRDTKKSGTLGLQVDFAPLHLTQSCTPPGCEQPNAILFAPGYEASAWPGWGRLYGEAGLLIAGVWTQGPDRGALQGLHGGIGVDLSGGRVMWNINTRLLWLQRSGSDNVFAVQLGVGVSPALGRPSAQPRGAGGH
jgi:hypothetical protein